MESRLICAFIVFTVCHISSVESYGTGAPAAACITMIPGHLYSGDLNNPIYPSDDPSPYSLTVDKTMVNRGGTVQVTINGTSFAGFLLQARLSDGSSKDPVGTFSTTVANTRTTDCTAPADSATHSSPDAKPDGTTVTWMAPNMEFANIKFIATVAQNHDVFWVDHESSVVEYDPTAEPTTEPTTEPITEPEPTTQKAPTAEPTAEPTTEPIAEPEPTTQKASWIVPSLSALMSLLVAVFVLNF